MYEIATIDGEKYKRVPEKKKGTCVGCHFHTGHSCSVTEAAFECVDWIYESTETREDTDIVRMVKKREARMQSMSEKKSPLDTQVGGSHYKDMVEQPIEYFCKNSTVDEIFGALRKDVMKYIWRKKGDLPKRLEDLQKAKHLIELYSEGITKHETV